MIFIFVLKKKQNHFEIHLSDHHSSKEKTLKVVFGYKKVRGTFLDEKKKRTTNALFGIIGERERTQLGLCLNKQKGRDLAE